MKLIKNLLAINSLISTKLINKINSLEKNIYYIKLVNLFSSFKSYFYIILKLLKFSLFITLIWRLILILNVIMGFDIILAYNNINPEILVNFFSIIFSEIIIYKDLYLQWLVEKINSFINKDITISDNKIESSDDSNKHMESHVDNIVVDNPVSNDLTLKRSDYKDTVISKDVNDSFYKSPYFYVPVILTISLIGIGFYYYYNPIWLDYINLTQIDIDNLMSDSLPGSPEDYSDYFNSPPLTPVDSPVGSPLGSPSWSSEGSPTPKQIRLHLPN